MKKHFFIISISPLAFFLLFFTSAFGQIGSWSAKANFGGTGRSNAAGFSIGSYGYIGTGYTGVTQKDFWRYDPAANTWTQMADFGGNARIGAVGFSIGTMGYIGTGRDLNNIYTKDFWKYNPVGNLWTQVANFAGNGRFYAAGFSIGNNGYVGTGMDGSSAYSDFYKYNSVTDTWTAKASYVSGIADCFAFAINADGYIGCGRNFAGSTYYNSFYQYDTTANTWTAKANFGGSVREGVAAFVIGNYGYAGTGGYNNYTNLYADFYKYDPAGNTWTAIAGFIGAARGNAVSFSIGNYGYAGTGYTGGYINTFYQYDLCGITTTVTATQPSCNGGSNGSINLTVANATTPFTYTWSNTSTDQDISGLSAGGYTVTITDGAGCTKSATVTVTEPTALSEHISTLTNASCYSLCNGKITVTTSGATAPYTYVWSPSVSSASSVTGLCAGNYTITVTDSKGCSTKTDSVITQPAALSASVSVINAASACVCDGKTNAVPTGGTAPYTYAWSPGGYTTSACTGLCSGKIYSVTITDSKGCTKTDTASISPALLTLSLTITPATCPSCANGSATANVTGGTISYTYLWHNGQTTQTATGLTPGYYSVCVYDAHNCSKCDSIYVGFGTGIIENYLENISIYPNPSTDGEFTIYGLRSVVIVSVYDMLGKEVYSSALHQKQETINLSAMREGVYFLKIKNQEEVVTKKIILNR